MNDIQRPRKPINEQTLAEAVKFLADNFEAWPNLFFPNNFKSIDFLLYRDEHFSRCIKATLRLPNVFLSSPEFHVGKDDPKQWAKTTWREFQKNANFFK